MLNIAGGEGLAAHAPVSFLDLVDLHQSVGTKRFAFNRDHGFRDLLDHLLLLRGSEYVFDYFNIYEWHFFVSF